jgi:hypothetical protein
MALQCDFEKKVTGFTGKLTAKSAYWRVERIEVGRGPAIAHVFVYDKPECNVVGSMLLEFDYDKDGPNHIAQAYANLKNLPALASCADC